MKNNLRTDFQDLSSDVLSYIKTGAEKALVDQHDLIRSVAGTIITTIVTRGGIVNWPEILQRFMDMAESPDPIIQEVLFPPPLPIHRRTFWGVNMFVVCHERIGENL